MSRLLSEIGNRDRLVDGARGSEAPEADHSALVDEEVPEFDALDFVRIRLTTPALLTTRVGEGVAALRTRAQERVDIQLGAELAQGGCVGGKPRAVLLVDRRQGPQGTDGRRLGAAFLVSRQ